MKVKITLGNDGYSEDAGAACDACWLDYEEIETAAQDRCDCPNLICRLNWCHDRSSGDRHVARQRHMRGLVSDHDLQLDPIPSEVEAMLKDELKAYNNSIQTARNTQDLQGARLFGSEAQAWAYEGPVSQPEDQPEPVQPSLPEVSPTEVSLPRVSLTEATPPP